jgi:serine protease Do
MGHGEHDDEPLDEGSPEEHGGAIPDPLDRLWRHPTELPPLASGFVPAPPARAGSGRRTRTWMLPIVGGATGALVTVAALAIAGVLDRGASTADQAGFLPGGVRVTATAPQSATTAGLSIVAIAARDGRGARRGSGVCVRHAGRILTSARVVGDATMVDVLSGDGQQHRARVVGRDRTTDLVLLEVAGAASVPAARLADTAPAAGSSVWVLGAARPGSSDLWQSSGLLASTDAIVAVDGGPMTSGLLETDASSGNAAAGGALIDRDGAVAGIVLSRVGESGTTYAVPIGEAVAIGEELDARGFAPHGAAGVSLVDTPAGPSIVKMSADGPAARAGARVGDVVMSIDGRPVESPYDVMAIVRAGRPNQTVTFELRRGKGELKVPVQLGATTA